VKRHLRGGRCKNPRLPDLPLTCRVMARGASRPIRRAQHEHPSRSDESRRVRAGDPARRG
jgi:hypothetical protein